MSDFGTMKTRIGNETLRTDTVSLGFIGDEIVSAIAHYENQPFQFNETRATASTVADTAYIALPTDFIDLVHMKVELNGSNYQMYSCDFEEIEDMDTGTYTGQPSQYAIYDQQFRLYPVPDTVYTLTLAYIKELGSLSADTDTNAWMTTGEELIRQRASAAFKVNYLQDAMAKQEQEKFAMMGKPFLSNMEASAYNALRKKASKYVSSGYNKATQF